jgi:ribosome-binding factor A
VADAARARKLGVRIRQIVASALETEVKVPRLGMVTITEVRMGADLDKATIFYTVYAPSDSADLVRADTAAALESAKGVLRTRVGRMTGVKNTPALEFVHDELPDSARHLDDLLAAARADDDRVRAARATAAPAGDLDPYRHPEEE